MNACSQSKGNIRYFRTTHNGFGPLQETREQGSHLKVTFQFLKPIESHLYVKKTATSFPPACSELRHSSQCIPPAILATYNFNPDWTTEK